MVKYIFLQNGSQRNAFVYVLRSNRSKYLFIYWKAPTHATLF